jgi:hypothetical protein
MSEHICSFTYSDLESQISIEDDNFGLRILEYPKQEQFNVQYMWVKGAYYKIWDAVTDQ